MRILFISPAYRTKLLENVKVLALPPLNLGILAGHTPEGWEVVIVDEAMQDIDFDERVDLVAISCMTTLAPRAYEISTRFRKRGIPVVIGGIHPSMMPEEAAQYADTVVAGEAETVWQTVLDDFEKGRMRPFYQGGRPDIEHLLLPRRELLPDGYFVQTVQTSRGCPFDCNFCSVTLFNGGAYRLRNIDDVIAETVALNERRVFFIDDNIIGAGRKCIDRAYRFFNRLKDTGIEWAGQTCLNIVEHDGLLKAAARSGAKVFLIGFESTHEDALLLMNKQINLRPGTRNFKDAIRKIHDHGIAIIGGLMFGTDVDTKDTFERTVEFILDADLDAVQLSVQTPFPGTRLFKQLESEGRLLYTDFPRDWERYNGFEPVFRPLNMTPEELYEGLVSSYRAVSSLKTSLVRGIKTFLMSKSLFSTGIAFFWNHDSYKTITRTARAGLSLK